MIGRITALEAMGYRTPAGLATLFKLDRTDDPPVLIAVWNGRTVYENYPPVSMLEELGSLGPMTIAQINRPVGGVRGRSAVRTSQTIADAGVSTVVLWARNAATFRSIVEECRQAGLSPVDRRTRYPVWRL